MKLMSVPETAEMIKSMEIRGAGRIARTAAEALRDHALSLKGKDLPAFVAEMERAAAMLVATRPTAVSLPNAVHIVMAGLKNRTKFIKGRCSRCNFLELCNANFRARAEAVYGDMWESDPACYLTEEEIGISSA